MTHSGDTEIAIDRWLRMLNESNFHKAFCKYNPTAISNHLSDNPEISLVFYGRLAQV